MSCFGACAGPGSRDGLEVTYVLCLLFHDAVSSDDAHISSLKTSKMPSTCERGIDHGDTKAAIPRHRWQPTSCSSLHVTQSKLTMRRSGPFKKCAPPARAHKVSFPTPSEQSGHNTVASPGNTDYFVGNLMPLPQATQALRGQSAPGINNSSEPQRPV